jgi:hypothetical protein
LVYFTAIWYILWPFGISCDYLVHFSPFWYVVGTEKNLATLSDSVYETSTHFSDSCAGFEFNI